MINAQPRIAVLIPAYNAEKTIHKALASLDLNKEPHDIVVVDDGSREPLAHFIVAKHNLIILRAEQNGGITSALNLGLDYILSRNYEFVARLDADDEASSDRLERQRDFLDRHADVGLLGSWVRVVSETSQELFFLHHPTHFKDIANALYGNSCFAHPSLMIRTALLREFGGYSPAYPSTEDYELIRRLAPHTRLANIPAYLLTYTLSSGGISQTQRRQQLISRLRVQWAYRDLSRWRFYLGFLKSLVLLVMPVWLLTRIKQKLSAHRRRL